MTEPEFSRELRILNLAARIESGHATVAEKLEAANSLSFAAGERLRLEQRVEALEKAMAFFLRVMKMFDDSTDLSDCLYWRINATEGQSPIRFYVGFYVGSGEWEEVTSANLSVLELAIADVVALEESPFWALQLFVGRVRGERPPKEALFHAPDAVMPLFNAIGPPR
jgi:hypothetical protein